MMNKMMNKTNEELVMMELNDDELNQVNGGISSEDAFLKTSAAIFGLMFFQIPGAILGAIFGDAERPGYKSEEEKIAKQNAVLGDKNMFRL